MSARRPWLGINPAPPRTNSDTPHEPTIAYVNRRTAEGLSKREIIRCLKRYLAREIYHLLPPLATTTSGAAPPEKLVA